jgi:transcriptional regulator with XRE-family HTH domain
LEFHAVMGDTEKNILIHIDKVASKFKQLRIEKGFSSHETFANEFEINRVQYWRIEKGHNITLKTFFKILQIHNLTPEEFFKDFS